MRVYFFGRLLCCCCCCCCVWEENKNTRNQELPSQKSCHLFPKVRYISGKNVITQDKTHCKNLSLKQLDVVQVLSYWLYQSSDI